ncbi:MAG TPA: type IV secretory system conjugative DNA transfer family protein, partial [Candidatus Sulfotelmatobacter sp.]|nr:type IV secretory system conjugative DNA transfer family protein [Candidatus Sulfotelmatobacter sp.]
PARLLHEFQTDHRHLAWWHLVGAGDEVRPWIFWSVLAITCALVGLVPLLVVAALKGRLPASSGGRLTVVPRTLPRTSRWATWADLRRLRVHRPRPGAFILGQRGRALIATERETSLLVIGPTRSGKTSSLVVPNLLDWRGPAIVTSTKNELVEITAGHRQRVGPVFVYDPTGELGEQYRSVTWSPIAGCGELDHAWMVASWLCAGLQQGSSKGDNDWTHWAESGKLLIAPLLYCAVSSGRHSIVDVRNWIHSFDLTTPMNMLAEMPEADDPSGNSDPQRAIAMLTSVDERPEKERGTVFSTVMRIFSVFNEKAVAQSAMASRFQPDEFLDRRGTLYLCTPQQAPERVASLFVGILMTVVTRAYLKANRCRRGRLDPELGLFLDEVANVVPIEELPAVASQGAGRGIVLMSIVQDLSQLRARYGADRSNSILNNHVAKMVLPGISDPETCELVARLVGRGQFTDVSVTRQDGKVNRSFSLRQDQIAGPDTLRQLREDTAVVVYRGRPPTLVRLRPWFRQRTYCRRAATRWLRNADQVARTPPLVSRLRRLA